MLHHMSNQVILSDNLKHTDVYRHSLMDTAWYLKQNLSFNSKWSRQQYWSLHLPHLLRKCIFNQYMQWTNSAGNEIQKCQLNHHKHIFYMHNYLSVIFKTITSKQMWAVSCNNRFIDLCRCRTKRRLAGPARLGLFSYSTPIIELNAVRGGHTSYFVVSVIPKEG